MTKLTKFFTLSLGVAFSAIILAFAGLGLYNFLCLINVELIQARAIFEVHEAVDRVIQIL